MHHDAGISLVHHDDAGVQVVQGLDSLNVLVILHSMNREDRARNRVESTVVDQGLGLGLLHSVIVLALLRPRRRMVSSLTKVAVVGAGDGR